MTQTTRRKFALGLGATSLLAACANGVGGDGGAMIDARVDETLRYMYATYPGTQDLASKAQGMLVMPLVTEVGLWVGGSYGRGALRIGQTTVDYYSAASASTGASAGARAASAA